jgi:3-oxoadipate enol-lactonase
MVFLHGVGSDKRVWAAQLKHFGRTRRALALDYPGYGESDPAPPDCARDDFAAALLAAMDACAVDRAHICGLSLGGVIAIALHAAAPKRCASLILADSFAVHPEGPAILDRAIEGSNAGMRVLAERRAPLLLSPTTPEQVRRSVIDAMAEIDPGAYRIGARAVWLADQRDRAAQIRVPTLVLVGDLDPVTPPALSQDLSGLIPHSKLEVIAGASHLSNLDHPDEFNRLVDQFLSEVEADA